MAFHWIIDRYRHQLRTPVVEVVAGESEDEYGIKEFGSPVQRFDDKIMADPITQALILYHWRSLRIDWETRSRWYIRKGVRFLPWLILWYFCSSWEWFNQRTLRAIYRLVRPHYVGLLSWRNLGMRKG